MTDAHITDDQPPDNNPWVCTGCGEHIECTFHACWNCGSTRDGNINSKFQSGVEPTQQRTSCQRCGYPLRDLTGSNCPECGTYFDPDIRDTTQEPQPKTLSTIENQRRLRLRIWLASWTLLILTSLVASTLDVEGDLAMTIGFIVFTILGGMSIFAPLAFIWSLFDDTD